MHFSIVLIHIRENYGPFTDEPPESRQKFALAIEKFRRKRVDCDLEKVRNHFY